MFRPFSGCNPEATERYLITLSILRTHNQSEGWNNSVNPPPRDRVRGARSESGITLPLNNPISRPCFFRTHSCDRMTSKTQSWSIFICTYVLTYLHYIHAGLTVSSLHCRKRKVLNVDHALVVKHSMKDTPPGPAPCRLNWYRQGCQAPPLPDSDKHLCRNLHC